MDKKIFLNKLGSHIAKIRKEKELSISELARLCDKDAQSIDRVEKGNINPSIYYLHQVSIALNISLNELLSFDD